MEPLCKNQCCNLYISYKTTWIHHYSWSLYIYQIGSSYVFFLCVCHTCPCSPLLASRTHVTHSTIWDVLNVLRMKNISVTAGLTAIGGNSYQLRRRAAPAHVCASDNTICPLRAKCRAGRRRHTRRRSVCPGAVYLINRHKYAGKEVVHAPRLHGPGDLGALKE